MINIKDIMKLVQMLVEAIPYLLPLLEMLLKMKQGPQVDPEDVDNVDPDEEDMV
ncbi:MAG: hypothetical protein IJV27_03885 [Prevotella sp.]|nr:hypothetical protein [Prevotella sp.]